MKKTSKRVTELLIISILEGGVLCCGCVSNQQRNSDNAATTAAVGVTSSAVDAASVSESNFSECSTQVTLVETNVLNASEVDFELDDDDYDGIVVNQEGNKLYLCGFDGMRSSVEFTKMYTQNICDDYFRGIQKNKKTKSNSWALYSKKDGKQILPAKAFTYAMCEDSSRYIKVCYKGKKTTSEEKALVYSTDAISAAISLEPVGDMYTGVIKIYDIQTGKMIPNIKFKTPYEAIYGCGDSILVKNTKKNTVVLYDLEGRMLKKISVDLQYYDLSVGDGVFSVEDGDGATLYNNKGEKVLRGTEDLECSYNLGSYATDFQNDVYILYDAEGNRVYQSESELVSSVHDGIAVCERYDEESEHTSFLLKHISDGAEVAASDTVFSYIDNGFWMDEDNGLYSKDGKINTLGEEENIDDFPIMETEDESTELYGVKDLLTGSSLLPNEYTSVYFIGDYVYAKKDTEYHVYQVVLS